MFAEYGFDRVFRNIGALHHDLLANHDGRGNGKIQFKIIIREILRFWLRCNFYFDIILLSQPGDDFLEVLSRLPIGLVEKKSD